MKNKSVLSLKEYKKSSATNKTHVIMSVSIRPDQKDYLEKHDIKVSELVRDLLDSVITTKKELKG